jgi:hypothetical protein
LSFPRMRESIPCRSTYGSRLRGNDR